MKQIILMFQLKAVRKEMELLLFLFILKLCSSASTIAPPTQTTTPSPYQPNWNSLDKRLLPEWFDKVKVGIFIHWGVYSVPSISSEWFWIDWKGDSYI